MWKKCMVLLLIILMITASVFCSVKSKKDTNTIVNDTDKKVLLFDKRAAASESYHIIQNEWQAKVYYQDEVYLIEARGEEWTTAYYLENGSIFHIETYESGIGETWHYYVTEVSLIHVSYESAFGNEDPVTATDTNVIERFQKEMIFHDTYITWHMDNENFRAVNTDIPYDDMEGGNEHFNYDALEKGDDD